tara:strand:+ start:304 stop:1032 length:729 start_codon:yes stop_codon:yes gene_type:complete
MPTGLHDVPMRWLCILVILELPLVAESPKQILELWRTLPKLAKTTPDQAYKKLNTWLPELGLRGLYAKAQFALNLSQLEKVSGHKIFLAGPHKEGELNLDVRSDFGHYNPKFLEWCKVNGIPGLKDAKLRQELQPVYEKFLRSRARSFFAAHKNLHSKPKRLQRAIDKYNDLMAAEKPAFAMQEFFRSDSDRMEQSGLDWFETNVAHVFWLRRTFDGSAKACHSLVVALLQAHDAKWLKQNR